MAPPPGPVQSNAVRYEHWIGWRYLYSGKRDPIMGIGAAVSLVVAGIGLYLVLSSDGGSPAGVITLVLGMLSTAVFGLLSIFSVFTSVSVLGVVLGVAALTIVLAVTTGFQEQFREKVLGVNAHVIIMKSDTTFHDYVDVMDTVSKIDRDVVAVQPFIFAEMLVTSGKGQSGVAIKGVDPVRVTEVLDLEKHMIHGDVESLARGPVIDATTNIARPPIIMGKELARKLKVQVGEDVTVVVPFSNLDFDTMRAKAQSPVTRKFRVTGIFYSGFDEYDRRLMYTSLSETQALLGRGDQVMGVELKVRDVDRAEEIADKIAAKLGEPPYQVQDWYELNHNLFTALRLQKLALTIILTLIIGVAAFNMVSALTMMVTDKTREIAIMKSMGAPSTSVGRTFLVVGIAISGVGTLVGVALGLVTCHVVSGYGYRLDPKVYLIDRLPISVEWFEVLLVCGLTMAIGIIATIVPSSRASALRPVDGLRYD
jgi:lipoprotein-releasing system permease protein